MLIIKSITNFRLLLFIFLFSIFSPFIACSQTDSLFWFAAPELQQSHGDRPILLRLSSTGSAASIKISLPSNPNFSPIQINLAANTSQSVDLTPFINSIENDLCNTVLDKGILIKSNSLISCYYDIANGLNGDIFSLKGYNGLGFKFTVPSQKAFSAYSYSNGYYCDLIICATENNTSITITPKTPMVGHPANTPFTIVLQRGQTYVCRADNGNPADRLGGTLIISSRPIAVTLKDDSIQYPGYGCADTAGDQLIPDNNTGTDFVVVKGYLYQPDNYYVFAIQNNTTVTVDGIIVATLNSGEYYRGILSTNSSFIQTSADAHVFQISGFGCEIGGAEIPSLRCTGSTAVSVTRATDQRFFINIIAPSNIIGNFNFNGDPNIITASLFTAVPNTNGAWMYTKYEANNTLMPAGAVAKITNTAGKFHMGIIHGDEGSTTRFGYFSDFSKGRFSFNYDSLYCKGQNVQISGNLNGATNFQWSGPNNFNHNGPSFSLPNIQNSDAGVYMLTAESAGCGIVNESIAIQVQEIKFNYNTPSSQCENNNLFSLNPTIQLNAGNINSVYYNWGDQTFGYGIPTSHRYLASGWYPIFVKVTTNEGCMDSLLDTITVLPISKTIIAKTICSGVSFMGYTNPGDYNQIHNAANGCDSIVTIRLSVFPKPTIGIRFIKSGIFPPYIVSFYSDINPNISGSYQWDFGDNSVYEYGSNPKHFYADSGNYNIKLIFTSVNGCSDTAIARLWINGLGDIFVPNAFSPNGDGLNDLLSVFGSNLEEFKMQIYNRWGELVFETNNILNKWNGRKMNLGEKCEIGNYVFVIFAKPKSRANRILKGNVILVR